MVKKILILSTFMLITLFPLNTFAEVVDGTATLGSGVLWNGSSYGFTPNVNLSYGSSNTYSYSSPIDNPFILGARYIAPLNLGSAGANSFSGVVEIPVAVTSPRDVTIYNRVTKDQFHISLGGFYDWGTLDYTVTDFSSTCGDYSPVEFSFPYTICNYRVSFTAKSSNMIYGGTNLSWALYDWSTPNNLVMQTLGNAWGGGSLNGSWAFPKRSTDIDGGENIAPYYVLSYGNNISETLLQQQIEQNQTIISQNQQIINNQNNNTNSIINNQDSNTQDIIDNQNSNTDKEIESQKVCNFIDKTNVIETNKRLSATGTLANDTNYGVTDYIKISKTSKIKLIENVTGVYANYTRLCFYNTNKETISCILQNAQTTGQILTIPNNSNYVRFTIKTDLNKPQFEICNNGNQALNDSVNDLNDTLNSEETPNTNQDINDMNDMVASFTPISDLITIPLTLINAYISGINSTCSPVNLGNLYGTDLILPCINLENRLGSNLWSIIDTFFCIFMCYNIGMLFITAFDGITSLRDDFESLYQPRHADVGYQPKHGGGN